MNILFSHFTINPPIHRDHTIRSQPRHCTEENKTSSNCITSTTCLFHSTDPSYPLRLLSNGYIRPETLSRHLHIFHDVFVLPSPKTEEILCNQPHCTYSLSLSLPCLALPDHPHLTVPYH
ncbi:hypothetical protein FOWG_07449 [Fusarium oxysporum f. sp. lycopersici MN25]|uniref:Uncharacterized protein n=1 Tax=Fusarium oxysporum Fo47 TaxID=660027 RepID=W9L0S7_FUSOX|nr:hypothetical protein FOZG_00882 [Fusarium oxysporum Fo47]EWZ92241.1 hypothetical protein FOWG_07449 [Fusarium oxysporum f. sp. lycopersici MN25]